MPPPLPSNIPQLTPPGVLVSIPGWQEEDLQAAARKYGVPYEILLGVYGAETGFGRDVRTSSAGAVGPFQFLPSTAAHYGYPLTNNPDRSQFTQQAQAAAHLLSDLYGQYGSWDTAIKHYSGGGYGLSHVLSLATGGAGIIGSVESAVGSTASSVGSAFGSVGSALGSIANFFGMITSPGFWEQAAFFLLGGILLILGVWGLAGSPRAPVQITAIGVRRR